MSELILTILSRHQRVCRAAHVYVCIRVLTDAWLLYRLHSCVSRNILRADQGELNGLNSETR